MTTVEIRRRLSMAGFYNETGDRAALTDTLYLLVAEMLGDLVKEPDVMAQEMVKRIMRNDWMEGR